MKNRPLCREAVLCTAVLISKCSERSNLKTASKNWPKKTGHGANCGVQCKLRRSDTNTKLKLGFRQVIQNEIILSNNQSSHADSFVVDTKN